MKDRVALVTGGSRGLGAEIVRGFARRGADVAFTYLKDARAAESVTRDVENIGRRAQALQADARDFRRAQEVVSAVLRDFGGLHVLVCNAGVAVQRAVFETTEDDWDSVVDVCLKGAFNYVRAASPHFRETKQGKIVCIGSINGLRGRPGTIGYNAAKTGLIGLVKTAATELGRYGVNANIVEPGFIETSSQGQFSQAIRDFVLEECAIKRLARPEDVAPVVAFLCSQEARHITGQIVTADAGQSLSRFPAHFEA